VGRSIVERKRGCLYSLTGGQESVVAGEVVETLRRLLDDKTRAPSGDRKILRGAVACEGRALGRCRIIIRAADHGAFEQGSILVSESTDPDLVGFLRLAGAVLTEQGGVTSHAAIICRELGVPAIIGIPGLLGRVQEGDLVDVDATSGIVRLLPKPAGSDPDPAWLYGDAHELPAGLVGGKAANLGLLRRLGYKVPDFVVLPYSAVQALVAARDPEAVRGLAARIAEQLGLGADHKVAVRSSCLLEDGDASSGAGRYSSLLDVRWQDLYQAFGRFVAENNGASQEHAYEGSIIVQRMINAAWSGVCLTRDVRAGYGDALILEMARGSNEPLTGGRITPDRVVVDRTSGEILADECPQRSVAGGSLDIPRLVEGFLEMEGRLRRPLDIEWAYADEFLHILQVRPIVSRGP